MRRQIKKQRARVRGDPVPARRRRSGSRATSCRTSASTCRPGCPLSAPTSTRSRPSCRPPRPSCPGQGQTVNIAGVKVGEVGSVHARGRHAPSSTMQIKDEVQADLPRRHGAAAPEDRPQGHVPGARPGHAAAPASSPRAAACRWRTRCPDVNATRSSRSSTATRAPTSQILLNAGGTAFDDKVTGADKRYSADRRAGPARDVQALRADRARRREDHRASWSQRRQQHQARDPQLPAALDRAGARATGSSPRCVDSANANFQAFASEEAALREALRAVPGRARRRPTHDAHEDERAGRRSSGPRSSGCGPFARELAPALRKTQPFFRETTPIIRDQIRPVRARRAADGARPALAPRTTCAVVTPRLTRSFGVLNRFFNTLAYDPPGARQPVPFWAPGRAHAGATLFDLQDAHGPVRRGIVLVSCTTYNVARAGRPRQPAARHC